MQYAFISKIRLNLRIQVLLDVTLCPCVSGSPHFEGT
jgi:hypothetical protein